MPRVTAASVVASAAVASPRKYRGDSYPADAFSGMEYDPFTVPPGLLFHEHYSKIRRNHQMWHPSDADDLRGQQGYLLWSAEQVAELASVVVLIIDSQSPLYPENDLQWKIGSALVSLGIDDAVVIEEALGQGAYFDQMLYGFFRMVNNLLYEEWWSTRTNFHNLTHYVRLNRLHADKAMIDGVNAANATLKKLRGEIYKLEATLFPGDERTAQLINQLAIEDEIGGYAEEYATEGEPLLGGGVSTLTI